MLDGGNLITRRDIVLPQTSTPFETAVASLDAHLLDLPADIVRAVKRVADCPPHLLGHLAWERSVDVWDPDWPVDMKRRVIAASYIVHRYKGTRRAVREALAALGYRTDITEWWETTPRGQPYTFKVRALALERLVPGQPVITEAMTRHVIGAINAAKPVSRGVSFEIGAGVAARAKIAACGRALQVATPPVITSPIKTPHAGLAAGVRGRGLIVSINGASAAPAKTPAGQLRFVGRARALTVFTARMEATLQ